MYSWRSHCMLIQLSYLPPCHCISLIGSPSTLWTHRPLAVQPVYPGLICSAPLRDGGANNSDKSQCPLLIPSLPHPTPPTPHDLLRRRFCASKLSQGAEMRLREISTIATVEIVWNLSDNGAGEREWNQELMHEYSINFLLPCFNRTHSSSVCCFGN